VAIRWAGHEKTRSRVLFRDTLYDIALLEIPVDFSAKGGVISTGPVETGQKIVAIGHPRGLAYTATQGIISKEERIYNGKKYIQIDAAINPGNSGGPLLNGKGQVIGINTFILTESESLAFAVPSSRLEAAFTDYDPFRGKSSMRCISCENVIHDGNIEGGYCSVCGSKVDKKLLEPDEYKASGISRTIENILEKINRDVFLARDSAVQWTVEQGTAIIKILYDERGYFIYFDATLCKIPKLNLNKLYEFLLRENSVLKGNSFSIYNSNIVLGFVVHAEDLKEETAAGQLGELLLQADKYDDILKTEYECPPVERE
jgi:serine protease Do